MHPILFRIPLPHMPLKLWWALAAVGILATIFAGVAFRKAERTSALTAGVIALAAGGAGYAFRATQFEAENLPIYSYGVMLGLSLVVGWYLTLTLAERDGLPKETMANCYVVTALAAIVGSRILYVVTNLEEFDKPADFLALRRGGLVAYGGFLGGFVGSWIYLANRRIRLMPWADVAVPSLASGLMITRIGCYLFGCDFGKQLPETAPAFLKSLGTFPHWAKGTLDAGDGSPAFLRHLEAYRGTPLGEKVMQANASLPVHPTQIYESLVGLALLVVTLYARKRVKFRGQVFFTFAFGYGVLRFLLEIIRDDAERGNYGPSMAEHVILPGALLLMALAFVFGMSLGITNVRLRSVLRFVAFVPAVATYWKLHPPSFGQSVEVKLSTSQWIALFTSLAVAFFYQRYWQEARRSPVLAMSLGEFEKSDVPAKAKDEDDEESEEDDDEESRDSSSTRGASRT
ncbi:MAG: prolipoprotein diacylglyceryl transferase [Polyangiaceae bacterium]